MRIALILPLVALAACSPEAGNQATGNVMAPAPGQTKTMPVLLTASDGVKVHGRYTQVGRPKALILLFHQAGSGKDEYSTIQPRLAEMGYSSLAIDQRSGGTMFGTNETVAALGRSRDSYEAIRDLRAAFDWATNQGPPVILWGSSYSASLVFVVAAERPGDAKAILAFSPGEYFGDTRVREAAANVRAPVFITSAKDDAEIAASGAIFDAVSAGGKVRHVPQAGVHGSSTLIADRNAAGAGENWRAVTRFLASVAP